MHSDSENLFGVTPWSETRNLSVSRFPRGLDQAGWHTTAKLKTSDNITFLPLPPRSPELNPAENVWEYLRGRWLSNHVFADYDAILDAVCDAWNRLIAEPKLR